MRGFGFMRALAASGTAAEILMSDGNSRGLAAAQAAAAAETAARVAVGGRSEGSRRRHERLSRGGLVFG